LTFLLSSCSSAVKPIEIFSKPVEIAIAQPPAPAPIKLTNITWKVLNIDDTIYYGLRVKDYELLSTNMLELKRYITNQNLSENEMKLGEALIEIFQRYDEIFLSTKNNKFNKNIILLSLREMTNLSTKEIRASLKKYKTIYINMLQKIIK
jgi:hypothetical protein